MSLIQDYAQQNSSRLLEQIQELVLLESPTHDRQRVNRIIEHLEKRSNMIGATTTRVHQTAAGDQLIARLGTGQRKTLLLGHVDTVWDAGQLERMPLRIEAGKAYGPGIFDMKSGAVLMLEVVQMAARGLCHPTTSLLAFYNSDEETGSSTSRQVLERLASECSQVLVFEPCLPGGKVKTFRKGVGFYTLEIFGKSAHAGVDPSAGVSAIEEFTQQVLGFKKIVEPNRGATINVGVVSGGTRSNMVPDYLRAEIDVRIAAVKDAEIIDGRLKSLTPVLSGATLRVSGGINRPPLERTTAVVQLFQKAAVVAREQGWLLEEGGTGGASDGCFTAARGVPTLDGLGPDGDGAHALNEHILIEDIPRRLALVATLLEKL